MKNSTLKFLLFASLILNISFLATAAYQYYRQSSYWASPFGYKIQKGHFVFEELSLRPNQRKAMREAAIKFRALIDAKREEIAGHRKGLIRLLSQDNPDRKGISAVVSQISEVQEQIQGMIAIHMLDMKAGLDKEQQKKFLDLIAAAMSTEGGRMRCPPVQQN